MSTRAPRRESFCFAGYHLGFRKHSFMVAGLLPAGPMVINQGQKRCRPLSLQQTLCAAAAGGLDGFLSGIFYFIYFLIFTATYTLTFGDRNDALGTKNKLYIFL